MGFHHLQEGDGCSSNRFRDNQKYEEVTGRNRVPRRDGILRFRKSIQKDIILQVISRPQENNQFC